MTLLTTFLFLTAPSFEGILEAQMTIPAANGVAEQTSLRYYLRAGRLRIDANAPGVGRVRTLVRDDKRVLQVFEASQVYRAQSLPDVATSPVNGLVVQRLGTKSLRGCPSEHVRVDTPSGRSAELWICPTLPWDALPRALVGGGGDVAVLDALARDGVRGFPLRMLTTLPGGAVQEFEITEIRPMTLEDSVFEVPDGFRKAGDRIPDEVEALKRKYGSGS